MTKLGRLFDTITNILSIIFLVLTLVLTFSILVFETGLGFIILLFIIILPFSLINTLIQKKAKRKYKAKVREQRLKFCMYCGGKLDSIQKFCPYCGKKFDESVNIITQTTEIENDLREEYDKKGKALSEQKEIYNISRKSFYKIILIIAILFPLGFYILIGILVNDFSLYPMFLLASLVSIVLVYPIGYFLNSMSIYSRFLISEEDIKIYIEKNIFFQVKWSEIDKIDIYRVRFHGHLLKINYSNTYKIISLLYCELSKKKQKEIIKTLFQFSEPLKDKISLMKTSTTIVDEVGNKELYEEIYQFARAQRLIIHKNIQ